ncbi:substrate-binding domain-containing protein [Candidatus Aerophobetes bacterium]|nr:substrate-binding domain-containing protein [Candidatus Aerophobetes bacterium]
MSKKRKMVLWEVAALVALLAGILAGFSQAQPVKEGGRLKVATTTSLYDTGLWDYLEPIFEERYKVQLDVIYGGSGIALEHGKRGDVDVLAIHDRTREDRFIKEGYGVNRRCFAYNYFILVGPENDPAKIKGLSPEDAFKKLLYEGRKNPARVKFVSRGDDSGTHSREKNIWSQAGYSYETIRKSGPWYIEAGRGMGPTLLMANEMQGYTLTDTGTFLALKGRLSLVPLVEKGKALLNVYAVLAVNPEKHPWVNIEMANKLINFLISEEIQKLIGEYGIKTYGMPLFVPCGKGACKKIGCPTWEKCAKPATWPPQ